MPFFAPSSRKASKFAIAAAIMSVGAFGVTAFDAPAAAKRDKKSEPKYSDEFRETIAPIQEALEAEGADKSAILDQIVAAESSVSTNDDKYVYGNTLYLTALELKNYELASKGMEMMLESGNVPEANMAAYAGNAGRLAFNIKNYPLARQRLRQAMELGSQDPELETLISQSYLAEGNAEGGLEFIQQQVDEQLAAGETPSAALLERGLMTAYNSDLYAEASDYALALAENYPDEKNWRNAIGVHRDLGMLDDGRLLDLMRLLRATGYMKDGRDYTVYIDAANYRVLPAEVLEVTEAGVAAGLLDPTEVFVTEALNESKSQAPGLRSDLGALARDAKASGASAKITLAAADAYLNFGEYTQAAELYDAALTRPGVDLGLALTRLAIAQYEAGDSTAALETLAKVEGERAAIAKLWAAFIAQQS
tara:strand:- start:95 stop:1363 length:1269 start_codon:yes stop_codon:yes gene_type:complete